MKDLLLVYIISFLATTAAISQTITEDQQISSEATSVDRFGAAIDISDTYAIVGAPKATSAANSGASYILEQQQDGTWIQVETLLPSRSTTEFGHSVTIDGDWALVGVPRDDNNGNRSGTVFVFQRQNDGTWIEVTELVPADNSDLDEFGRVVELQGDIAVIGAPTEGEEFTGAVYVFERQTDNSWSEVDKLIASDPRQLANFGGTLSVDGTLMAVGAWEDGETFDEEAVYMFEQQNDGTWSQVDKVQPDTPVQNTEFGSGVSVEGDLLLVGAYKYGQNSRGTAFLFEQQGDGTWAQQAMLDEGGSDGGLGNTVALSNGYALVGHSAFGQAFLYQQLQDDTWSHLQTLEPSGNENSFASEVALSSNKAFVTDPGDKVAYFYQLGEQVISYQPPLQLSVGATFDLVASSNSGLTLSYESSDPGIAAVSAAGVVTALAAGTANITISQAGDGFWLPFEEVTTVTVIDAPSIETITEAAVLPLAENAEEGSEFGDAIAISGDFSVIGAPSRDQFDGFTATNSGMALVYQRQADGTWQFDDGLRPSDLGVNDGIGASVDIDGTRIIISATGDDEVASGAGAAYIFDRQLDGTWAEQAKLTADDGDSNYFFGRSVAVDGDRAVVSSAHFGGTAENAGKVYVFEKQNDNTWSQVASFESAEPTGFDYFGWSVDLYGDRIAVGTMRDDDLGNSSGSASIFERQNDGTWTEADKLLADPAGADDLFGRSVALEGDRVVVGAPFSDIAGEDVGAAFVFDRQQDGTWTQVGTLASSMVDLLGEAGKSVDLMGGKVLVGADNSETGAVLYEEQNDGTWLMTSVLSATDADAADDFGNAVALGNGEAMVGAPLLDEDRESPLSDLEDTGASFLFDLGDPSMALEQTITVQVPQDVINTELPFTLETVTNSDLPLTFTSSDPAVATLVDGIFTPLTVGSTTITISQAGDAAYAAETVSFEVIIEEGLPLELPFASITDNQLTTGAQFGWSVAMSGDYAIVGAPKALDAGTDQGGAIYFYERQSDNSWLQTDTYSELAFRFAESIAINGSTAVVGDGVIFERQDDGTWADVQSIANYDLEEVRPNDNPGDVALTDNYLAFGFPEAGRDRNTGVAVIYSLQADGSWSHSTTLNVAAKYLAIDGDRLLVNGKFLYEVQSDDTWTEVTELTGSFGGVADLSGDVIVANSGGQVSIYTRQNDGSWTEQNLSSADPFAREFGSSVSIQGDMAVIGAYASNSRNEEVVGAAYVIKKQSDGSWIEQKKLLADDGSGNDFFGYSISLSGRYALVGAPQSEIV